MDPIDPVADPTGGMTQEQINAANIDNLMNEWNRTAAGQGASRQVNGTDFYYDSNGINYMQIGILPDGSYGWVIARSGYNVSDAFS